MDIQVVGNVYGAAKYVCHYMSKDEPEQIKQQIARKLDGLPENCSQRQKTTKIRKHFNKSQNSWCSRGCILYNRITFKRF